MALARVKSWNAGDTLTAADLNGEFNNILNNPITLISPSTAAINFQTSVAHTNLTPSALTASSGGVNAALIATSSGVSVWNALPMLGLCRLAYVTSSAIRLSPSNGNLVPIRSSGGIWGAMPLPSTGVDLSSTNFATATSFNYIYAFSSTGVVTLVGQTSSFSHATSTENGVEIMTTDASRTLVGMIYTSTTAQNFSTVGNNNLVASYFQRRTVGSVQGFSVNRTVTSTAPTEFNTEIRNQFMTWSDEAVVAGAGGGSQIVTGGNGIVGITFDGATMEDAQHFTNNAAIIGCGISLVKNGLSEGYHFATLSGYNSANGSGILCVGVGTVGGVGRTNLTVGVRV